MDKAEGRLNKAEDLVQSMTEELKLWYEYHIPGMPYTTSAPVQACNLSGPKSEKLSPYMCLLRQWSFVSKVGPCLFWV